MKTMREKWICPNMDVQVFTPQEFVAGCEVIIEYTYEGMKLRPNYKFFEDTDKLEYTMDPSLQSREHQTHNYDQFTLDLDKSSYYYFFDSEKLASAVFSSPDIYQAYLNAKADKRAGYVIGEASNSGGQQLHAGTIVEHSYKNQS